MESTERPFGELPAALVNEVLERIEDVGQKLLADFERVRAQRREWRTRLTEAGLLRRDAELAYMPIPTTCGVDGSYAIERLLASDLVAAAAVAVEGLTPPSETRHWPEPRHLVWVETEAHRAETGTILRALMIGMELELASQAPHEVIFLDGSLTTPLIYFNQALNASREPGVLVYDHRSRFSALLCWYTAVLQRFQYRRRVSGCERARAGNEALTGEFSIGITLLGWVGHGFRGRGRGMCRPYRCETSPGRHLRWPYPAGKRFTAADRALPFWFRQR